MGGGNEDINSVFVCVLGRGWGEVILQASKYLREILLEPGELNRSIFYFCRMQVMSPLSATVMFSLQLKKKIRKIIVSTHHEDDVGIKEILS